MTNYGQNDYRNYLAHYGVLGMKWGVRHDRRSLSGTFHRVLAANNRLNAKTYRKLGNNTLASMNEAATKQQMKKAEAADARKREKIREKSAFKEKLTNVYPSVAKNKQTRRVAYDYHNLSDDSFRRKYKTSRKTFAKRYAKTKGNTYGSGVRKAAISAFIVANSSDIPYRDLRSGRTKTIKAGKKAAVSHLAMDIGYSEAATRIGYKKAEEKYNQNNKRM